MRGLALLSFLFLLPTTALAGAVAYEDIPGNKFPRKHTVYVAFDEVSLVQTEVAGEVNSALDQWSGSNGNYPAWDGNESERTAAVAQMQELLSPYGVRVTATRPPDLLPYTMVFANVGTDSLWGPFGITDCGERNQRSVGSMDVPLGSSPEFVAAGLVKAAAFNWGLMTSLNPSSLTCSEFSSAVNCDALSQQSWIDACVGVNTGFSAPECGAAAGGCPDGQHNEHQALLGLFGDATPDTTPPTAEITSPPADIQVEVGSAVELRATIDDDFGGVGYRLELSRDGEVVLDDVDFDRERVVDAFEVGLELTGLEEGVYVFTVEAADHADHVTTDEVTITVGGVGMSSGSSGTTDGTSGASTGEGTTSTDPGGSDDTNAAGTDTEGDLPASDGDDGEGCGCRTRSGTRGYAGWLLLGVLGFRRRRRARSARPLR